MLGRSTRTLIMHRLGHDTSSALFHYWVWFLSLQNPAWKHPMTLVLNLNAHSSHLQWWSYHSAPPMHTVIYDGCVCLQPSIRINTCWGRAEDSLVSLRTQDPAPTSPNKLFILEQRSMWKMRQSSGSRPRWPQFHLLSMWKIKQFKKQILITTTISSALVVWFPCRYGWGWSTANCSLNPFS